MTAEISSESRLHLRIMAFAKLSEKFLFFTADIVNRDGYER